MGLIKVKGIVIAENNMSDFDKMVTILTPNGKIGCAAKGARRPKSQLLNIYVLVNILFIKVSVLIILTHVKLPKFSIILEWI